MLLIAAAPSAAAVRRRSPLPQSASLSVILHPPGTGLNPPQPPLLSTTMYASPTLRKRRPHVRLPNGMLAKATAHPSRGGRAWPIEIRNMVVSMYLNGDNFHDVSLVQLRANYKFPSMRTVYRWLKRYNNGGTVHPKRPTGNRHSTREVSRGDLINLALFRLVRPKAYIDEVRAYVHNQNPANPPYS